MILAMRFLYRPPIYVKTVRAHTNVHKTHILQSSGRVPLLAHPRSVAVQRTVAAGQVLNR